MTAAVRPPRQPIVKRFAAFGLVGGSGVLVNMGLLYLLTAWLRWDYRIAALIAIECAILNNFTWNYRWTWHDRRRERRRDAAATLLRFNLTSGLVAMFVNWALLVVLKEFFGVNYLLANIVGIGFGTAANFALSHWWVFPHAKTAATTDGR